MKIKELLKMLDSDTTIKIYEIVKSVYKNNTPQKATYKICECKAKELTRASLLNKRISKQVVKDNLIKIYFTTNIEVK